MEEMEKKPKKKSIWKRLEENKKLQVLVFVVSMVVLVGVYVVLSIQIDRRFEIIEDDFSWVYQIDYVENQEGKLSIVGFAFKEKQNAPKEAYEIVLYDIDTGKKYFPRMSYRIRNDVNNYFLCEYDYSQTGFEASISIKNRDFENKIIEILLRPKGEKEAYSTGIFYSDGELMYVNPKDYIPLETEGTDLQQIVEEGVLKVYRPDYGIYVYQYNGDLYWIADEWCELVENDVKIQYQMNTTQINRLPQERLDNNWHWSNLSFYFEAFELSEWNTGKYKVSKHAIPREYSITKIWTGSHNGEWIWRSDFRPWYEFD